MAQRSVQETLNNSEQCLELSRRHLEVIKDRIALGGEFIELSRLSLMLRWPRKRVALSALLRD